MRRGGAGKKRDANEEAIVSALASASGCSVYRLTGVGLAAFTRADPRAGQAPLLMGSQIATRSSDGGSGTVSCVLS